MQQLNKESVLNALSKVMDPELKKDLVSLNMIRDIKIFDHKVRFTLLLTTPACPLRHQLEAEARKAMISIPGVTEVEIKVDSQVPKNAPKMEKINLPIKHIVTIASGKGGVGKSTISVNIAIALAQSGAKVGLLDADIYGPNIPIMMGVKNLPDQQGQKIIPAEAYGVKVMSTGFLVKKEQPLIWRGPLLHSAIKQFLTDVEWGEVDYLIIDLPPGTGDVQLSLSQIISISGGVIVTTPQQVSKDDAGRALVMFQKLQIPILGVIENMGYLLLPDGSRMEVFGEGGGQQLAENNCVPFLGSIDLYPPIRKGSDEGKPIIVLEPDSQPANQFRKIAGEIAAKLSVVTLQKEI